jgi:hypothetical protein
MSLILFLSYTMLNILVTLPIAIVDIYCTRYRNKYISINIIKRILLVLFQFIIGIIYIYYALLLLPKLNIYFIITFYLMQFNCFAEIHHLLTKII